MLTRSVHMPYYIFLIGLLSISVGYNLLFWNRIQILTIKNSSSWVTPQEMEKIQQEITRLEKESANLSTK